MKAPTNLRSRQWLTILAGIGLALGLVVAFWPRPADVDMAIVERKAMSVTIDEQARTRVRDPYVVSLPLSGRLLRVEAEPGDRVVAGKTVVARVAPAAPGLLDMRSREQASAAIRASEAAVRLARAELQASVARRDRAAAALERARVLGARGLVSDAALDAAREEAEAATASVSAGEASVRLREAELAGARALIASFRNGEGGEVGAPLLAPVSGQILRVLQDSEAVMPAGAAILEIGDVAGDLEVVCELLSADAVRVRPGMRVIIDDWGGDKPLEGEVIRVEPSGFTKFSALGVEEQRVNVVIRFTSPAAVREGLGAGFRVEARVVIWESASALVLPSAGLFRTGPGWAVFVLEGGRVRERPVEVGRNNGVDAEILGGLTEGERIVVHPPESLREGRSVRERR
jgi:HlyD family secretion protein